MFITHKCITAVGGRLRISLAFFWSWPSYHWPVNPLNCALQSLRGGESEMALAPDTPRVLGHSWTETGLHMICIFVGHECRGAPSFKILAANRMKHLPNLKHRHETAPAYSNSYGDGDWHKATLWSLTCLTWPFRIFQDGDVIYSRGKVRASLLILTCWLFPEESRSLDFTNI